MIGEEANAKIAVLDLVQDKMNPKMWLTASNDLDTIATILKSLKN
jgi:hypothetical protein